MDLAAKEVRLHQNPEERCPCPLGTQVVLEVELVWGLACAGLDVQVTFMQRKSIDKEAKVTGMQFEGITLMFWSRQMTLLTGCYSGNERRVT